MNKDHYQTTDVMDRLTRYETIMLIDDNPLDNFVNRNLLEKDHFARKVLVCETAKQALEFLSSASENDLPDLVFLDINMPEMDGFEFLDHFACLSAPIINKCKVIMLSTSESFKDLNRANKNLYVRKFLNKPLTDQVLRAINI